MRIVATILGVIGGLAALVLGGVSLDVMGDAAGTDRWTHAMLAYALLPLGVIAIVGAFLGGRRRRLASLWVLVVAGALMLAVAAVNYVVVWRDADLSLTAANIGLLAPGVVTIIAALFRLAKPKG